MAQRQDTSGIGQVRPVKAQVGPVVARSGRHTPHCRGRAETCDRGQINTVTVGRVNQPVFGNHNTTTGNASAELVVCPGKECKCERRFDAGSCHRQFDAG